MIDASGGIIIVGECGHSDGILKHVTINGGVGVSANGNQGSASVFGVNHDDVAILNTFVGGSC